MKKLRSCIALFTLVSLLPLAPAQTPAPAKEDASAAIQKKDTNGAFIKKHESFLARAKAGPIDLLFLGDSITDGWSKAPHIWERYYGAHRPANFGIGDLGPRTLRQTISLSLMSSARSGAEKSMRCDSRAPQASLALRASRSTCAGRSV